MAGSLTDLISQSIEKRVLAVIGLLNYLYENDIDYGHTAEYVPITEDGGAHKVCDARTINVSNKSIITSSLEKMLFKDVPEFKYGVEASLKIKNDNIRYNALETIAINAKEETFAENALEQISNIPETMIIKDYRKHIASIFTFPAHLGYHAYFKTSILRNVVGNSQSEAIRGKAFELILGIKSEELKSELLNDIFHYDQYKIKECIEAIASFKNEKTSAKQLYHMFSVASMSVSGSTSAEECRMANKKIGLLFQHLDLFKKELFAERDHSSLKSVIEGGYGVAKSAYSLLKEINPLKAMECAAENARDKLKKEANAELKEHLAAIEPTQRK